MNLKEPPLVKLAIVGDAGVGKTSIAQRISLDRYDSYTTTTAVSFVCKTIKVENTWYQLQVTDLPPPGSYYAFGKAYIRSADVIIIVVDLNDHRLIERLGQFWIRELRSTVPRTTRIICCGAKSDKVNTQQDRDQLKNVVAAFDLDYVECSALTGEGIKELISRAIGCYIQEKTEKQNDENNTVSVPELLQEVVRKKQSCC